MNSLLHCSELLLLLVATHGSLCHLANFWTISYCTAYIISEIIRQHLGLWQKRFVRFYTLVKDSLLYEWHNEQHIHQTTRRFVSRWSKPKTPARWQNNTCQQCDLQKKKLLRIPQHVYRVRRAKYLYTYTRHKITAIATRSRRIY